MVHLLPLGIAAAAGYGFAKWRARRNLPDYMTGADPTCGLGEIFLNGKCVPIIPPEAYKAPGYGDEYAPFAGAHVGPANVGTTYAGQQVYGPYGAQQPGPGGMVAQFTTQPVSAPQVFGPYGGYGYGYGSFNPYQNPYQQWGTPYPSWGFPYGGASPYGQSFYGSPYGLSMQRW